jgi:hypothetical protein
MRRRLSDWWRSQPKSTRRWSLFATALVLILLTGGLARSGREIKAIRWHHENGDRVGIHDISFPIYFWYAPNVDCDVLDIFDDPGPLRPTDDQFVSIHISWIKDDPYAGLDRLTGLSAAERAQQKANSFGRAGYQNVQIFSHRYLDQDFACVRELDPRFHEPEEHGGSFSCYGDGPVYLISFAGYGRGQDHFEQMLMNAKRVAIPSALRSNAWAIAP